MAGSFASTDSSKTISLPSQSGSTSAALTSILTHAPHEFLQPSGNAIQDAALNLVKRYFDPLLKGGAAAAAGDLDTVYLDGFDVEQVWEQVRGVVENLSVSAAPEAQTKRKAIEYGSSGSGSESESDDEEMMEDDEEEKGEEGEEEEFAGFDDVEEEEEDVGSEEGGVTLEDGAEGFEGSEDEEEDDDDEAKEFVKDVHGLNDGFFSIDDFNRQSELMELQDSRGGMADDDEDDIDYFADPNALDNGSDDDEEEEEEAPRKKAKTKAAPKYDYEEESDDEMDLDQDAGDNTNDIMYEDFFAPPARRQAGGKPKNRKSSWKNDDPEAEYEAIESDMARVRRDLFDDEDEESDGDVDMDGDPGDPLSRRSAHQKRQATLLEEIRKLEQENIAKKQWTLKGEAKARDRPLNSLLEEDLDFERSGKPAPVITQEVTEGLEDMIKRRILNGQFDEVIRRRPGEISEKFRRGRVEIDDSKPQESLAEVYEKEHQNSTNPELNPNANDEKLQKEYKEIEGLWQEVSRKLDALSSWHFTPKPAKPTLAIVSDAPAISMEEAQPSAAAGGMAANVSMLAPQEIYKPGKDKASLPIGEGGGREIVGKSGAPISTREMTSDEKRRRRRREKEKIRKRNASEGISRGQVKEGSKKDVVDTLKRGNVAVIGKGGEKRSIEGKEIKVGKKPGTSANFLKL
ncbi:U3 small nucleolar ribonucleo protein complex, subunit Mpp10 [Sphaerosporella brunnea]|uniref:U3 small nucleolar ribonucleoprotein protein MPP10 n=1 Tax=Sphaerosporella brunnea TaxID=1250544 RepID=A0A5J5F8R9_9PEZI|nr:U3 small nucleolar ribonucleo protein complex, subunit Mpp10 [Sphaerosporella brunnea]